MHGHHAERGGPAAELYRDHHVSQLGVCGAHETGEHGQLQDGGGDRGIGCTAQVRDKLPIRHGIIEVRERGHTL